MSPRRSGILLHVTSLPGPYGIGDLGPAAHRFADTLRDTGQSCWQVLPLNPADAGGSPYSSVSAFAGHPLLISPEVLLEQGLLTPDEAAPPPFAAGWCDFKGAARFKSGLFDLAFNRFRESPGDDAGPFREFCAREARWLEDYALFVVLKRLRGGRPWHRWPAKLRDRDPAALEALRRQQAAEIEREKFLQYLFFAQWAALRARCRGNGIVLFGDLPIYVAHDSADVWAHRRLFRLNADGRPAFVAGVPPDYFSRTGQLWGNPVYDWEALRESGYGWWVERLAHNFRLFDLTRIDHFRGLVAFWEVPAGETTALNGKWSRAPAEDFFRTLIDRLGRLPIVAEDLGTITPDVREVMRTFGFPGMKVLLFAFSEDDPGHAYLPHNYERNCVVYTGTHDNNTARGWFRTETTPADRARFFRYLGRPATAAQAPGLLIRLASMSVADTVLVPMQDVLALGPGTRMNRPGQARGNWRWRLRPGQADGPALEALREWTRVYGRLPGRGDAGRN